MLDTVTRRLVEFGYERRFRQGLLGGSVKVGPTQLPALWAAYQPALEVLDMSEVYDLYVTNEPSPNAMALGAGKPVLVVNSALVTLLDERELQTVLAHEVAHILSDHVLYRTALEILLRLGASARLPLLTGLPVLAVRSALLEWSRASELSSDRAATLVNGDPLTTCRTLMALAAGIPSTELDLDAFLQQAHDFDDPDDGFDRVSRFLLQARAGHALPVRRCAEVQSWVQSGAYERVRDGGYLRRGTEPPARAEAGDAVTFYSDRFAEIFREAGDAVQSVGGQVSDWLRGSRRPPDDDL